MRQIYWSESSEVASYLKGLPSLFNFDLGYAITDVAKAGRDSINLVMRYKEIRDYYKSITDDYLDATFIKNRDQTRLLTELGGNVQKARTAAAILLTFPGTSYLYYGEEIGMRGDKLSTYEDQFGPDAFVREPYVWDADGQDHAQTSWERPRYSTAQTVKTYNEQTEDPSSHLNFYKDLINFRNTSAALTYGDIETAGMHIEEIVSFVRKYQNEELLVLHNVADVAVTLELQPDTAGFSEVAFDTADGTLTAENGQIKLPAYTTVILKQN